MREDYQLLPHRVDRQGPRYCCLLRHVRHVVASTALDLHPLPLFLSTEDVRSRPQGSECSRLLGYYGHDTTVKNAACTLSIYRSIEESEERAPQGQKRHLQHMKAESNEQVRFRTTRRVHTYIHTSLSLQPLPLVLSDHFASARLNQRSQFPTLTHDNEPRRWSVHHSQDTRP